MALDYRAETTRLFELLQHVEDPDDRIKLRNKIIELNIRLVSQVLKKYRPYDEDNFQNGCIGLINAAQTYEPMREVPFASYACFCIERELQMAYNKKCRLVESMADGMVSLNEQITLSNGDTVDMLDTICDESALKELDQYIEDNEMDFISTNIIKPCILEIANRGRHMQSKLDVDLWQKLEFLYIMDLVFVDSQKQRFNLSQFARKVDLSVQNVRTRHERVMEIIFQRMWDYMNLSFNDMLTRLRGSKRIPERLLCLDPGKTTGWCLFENGKLTRTGHIEDCYDDSNVDVLPLMALLEDIKPDFVLYEDYRVYSHKLDRHSYSPVFTVRLIGAIETYCQVNVVNSHKQMATTAKGFVTDEKLKQWGFWQSGMKHARDAIRHGCYFLLFYKKGNDLV